MDIFRLGGLLCKGVVVLLGGLMGSAAVGGDVILAAIGTAVTGAAMGTMPAGIT